MASALRCCGASGGPDVPESTTEHKLSPRYEQDEAGTEDPPAEHANMFGQQQTPAPSVATTRQAAPVPTENPSGEASTRTARRKEFTESGRKSGLPSFAPQWVQSDFYNQESWNPVRRHVHRFLSAKARDGTNIFDASIGVVIVLNVIVMIAETDASQDVTSGKASMPPWITYSGYVFLFIYTTEALLRMINDQAAYVFNPWNLLDVFIVGAGLLGLCLTGTQGSSTAKKVQLMRIARIARIIRVAKLLSHFETLSNMVRGFAGAMAAMFWGIVLILVLIMIWSILAVELMNEVNRDIWKDDEGHQCAYAFSSVYMSTLTFFQTLVAGDSWGTCALPLIDAMPFSFFIFAGSLVCINLGFTNLVLAVIVDKASAARDEDQDAKLKAQKVEEQDNLNEWRNLMQQIDQDSSGTVSLQEIKDGFEDQEMRDRMHMMSIDEADMDNLFRLMDVDDSGSLGYDEFVQVFHKAHTQDANVYRMVMRLEISKILYIMETRFQKIEQLLEEKNVVSEQVSEPSGITANPYLNSLWQTTGVSARSGAPGELRQHKIFQGDPQLTRHPPEDVEDGYGKTHSADLSAEETQVQQVPSSLLASHPELFRREAFGPSLPAPWSGGAAAQSQSDGAEGIAVAQHISARLRSILEEKLGDLANDLANEAAGMASQLASQEALLETLYRSSEAEADVSVAISQVAVPAPRREEGDSGCGFMADEGAHCGIVATELRPERPAAGGCTHAGHGPSGIPRRHPRV